MAREEEVKHAAYSQYCNSESICFTLLCNSFKQGAEWADSNPKSPWINVKDDLPCNHKELISPDDKRDTLYVVAVIRGHIIFSRMYKLEGKWSWENDEPTYWMPIPELPKEKEIKL